MVAPLMTDLRMNLGALPPRTLRRPAIASAFAVLAALATFPAAEPAAWAQGAPPAGDSVTIVARQRYNEGVQAYDAGRFEDARAAFLQAYALKHHPAVLLNLGQSEIRSGHYDDAGNHLQQFIREFSAATPDQRAAAEKGLAEAKKKAGLVVISVDAPGADVSIDGTTVGKTPLIDPVFVMPGKHTVVAASQGKTAAASVDVKAGVATPASLTLGVSVAPPAPPVPAPVPVTPEPVTPPSFPPPGLTPIEPVAPPAQPPPETGHPRETFGEWYRHKPLAWVGTGIAGLGFIGGIAFGASAMNASSSAGSDVTQIMAHNKAVPSDNPNHVANLCTDQAALMKAYAGPCSTLQGNINNYHTDIALTATSWVFFGVGVLGTALYALVNWYPNRAGSGSGRGDFGLPVALVPVVGPTLRGAAVGGSF